MKKMKLAPPPAKCAIELAALIHDYGGSNRNEIKIMGDPGCLPDETDQPPRSTASKHQPGSPILTEPNCTLPSILAVE